MIFHFTVSPLFALLDLGRFYCCLGTPNGESKQHDTNMWTDSTTFGSKMPSLTKPKFSTDISSGGSSQSGSNIPHPTLNDSPDTQRRVNLVTKHFKDVLVRSYPNFVQVILSPVTTGIRHTVNANVCDELMDIMKQLLPDQECRAVLVTGIGQTFCQGNT